MDSYYLSKIAKDSPENTIVVSVGELTHSTKILDFSMKNLVIN